MTNCTNLETLDVSECEKLHGELDVSCMPYIQSVSTSNCDTSFVVVISSECPLAHRVPSYDSHISIKEQRSIEKLHGLFLSKKEDKKAAHEIIRKVRGHNRVGNAQKMYCLSFLRNYCGRYANASKKEKAKAAEKYISALKKFSSSCGESAVVFEAGLSMLKVELGLVAL